MALCFKCGTLVPNVPKPGRNSYCTVCSADIKICLLCRFYSPGSHWDCAENIPESVREKDRNNFCEYFELSSVNVQGKKLETQKAQQARDKFNNLFSDNE